VVHISHEAFFSPRDPLEFSLCGASAFGLEFTTEMLVSSLNLSNVRGTVEFIVGENCMVDDARVDTKDCTGRAYTWGGLFDHNTQYKMGAVEGELCSDRSPIEILSEINWEFHIEFDAPLDAGERDETATELGSEGSLVVSYCRPTFLLGEAFEFNSLEHLGSAITSCTHKIRWNCWMLFTNWIVCEMVEFELVENLFIEARLENFISGEVDGFNCADQSFFPGYVEGDGPLHTTSLHKSIYIVDAPITPTVETVGFLGGLS
jgi:hypothetical protein